MHPLRTEVIEAPILSMSKRVEILNVHCSTPADLLYGKAALTLDMAIRITWQRISGGVG